MRSREERQVLGWIPGSVCLASELVGPATGVLDTAVVALVCNSGRRARIVAEEMVGKTEIEISWLEGGILAWAEAGLPLVSPDREAGGFEDMDASTPGAVLRTLRSCFVAELIEGPLRDDDECDPIALFDRAVERAGFAPEEARPDDLKRLVELLAAASRRLGGSHDRIADNVTAVTAVIERLEG